MTTTENYVVINYVPSDEHRESIFLRFSFRSWKRLIVLVQASDIGETDSATAMTPAKTKDKPRFMSPSLPFVIQQPWLEYLAELQRGHQPVSSVLFYNPPSLSLVVCAALQKFTSWSERARLANAMCQSAPGVERAGTSANLPSAFNLSTR